MKRLSRDMMQKNEIIASLRDAYSIRARLHHRSAIARSVVETTASMAP